ncbi:hypothetical protein H8S90_22625 [Olivibacter sp. SDN3]|uniref:hypothetical protein n=1 Tax=Olivibacter sp. SDN3 TaxID=2764720 RepID=UPI0016515556|nr:hypothetical protein [Olivibacter sp. SDN3]QNL49489.1 hypothetical protein H8S90_22625 [Olivibacter sp. SDN3]
MAISIAPIYADLYDSDHVIAAIMQLEIENHSSKSSCSDVLPEHISKDFTNNIHLGVFMTPIRYLSVKQFIPDDARDIKSFYPSVPTPPPNG